MNVRNICSKIPALTSKIGNEEILEYAESMYYDGLFLLWLLQEDLLGCLYRNFLFANEIVRES